MGIRFRLGMEGKMYHRVTASLSAAVRRVTMVHLPTLKNSISIGMFTSNHCLPYEASKTYRTIMTEFDCRRSRTQYEVNIALMHAS